MQLVQLVEPERELLDHVELKDSDGEQEKMWKSHGIPSWSDIGPSDTPIKGIGERLDCVGVDGCQRLQLHQRELVPLLTELIEDGTCVMGESTT